MSKFIFAFINNNESNGNNGNDQVPNIPEGAVQVTGFTGDYEKYNGIYLQELDESYSPDNGSGYHYNYVHESEEVKLFWNGLYLSWTFYASSIGVFSQSETCIDPTHPSNYTYDMFEGHNSGNPIVY